MRSGRLAGRASGTLPVDATPKSCEDFVLWLMLAAVCELLGCFAVWRWARDQQPAWWLLPGLGLLFCFAWALTRAPAAFAGRAFAA
jgi:drug/metabolite transporter superfamily protein YnfA